MFQSRFQYSSRMHPECVLAINQIQRCLSLLLLLPYSNMDTPNRRDSHEYPFSETIYASNVVQRLLKKRTFTRADSMTNWVHLRILVINIRSRINDDIS